ncbi:MAG: prolyl oligopeptidase family serine peptidase, partial [Candidatus Fervidibacter sacchari]
NSNNPSWEPDYLGGFPWEVPELYLQRSPFIHAHKIKSPLLLLHGESDLNTFISNSQEMFSFNPTMVRLLQGKNLGFGSKMRRNEKEVAVDLQLPEKPKDDKRPFKIGSFWAKIATLTLFGFQSAQNGLG